ncbi:hypothetical protein GPX89_15920 [Nocardia sp. ET3-3]|uniref:Uncharacterized protein n=1 Tax=Nocardia terrae TaxID=2675851 RepID=A0A7K1UWF9_9NOCA|nr:hypothetical protein [Nocardia terrae]MVU78726.1 hypothetical protein [Nocardia terrae]
MWSWSNHQSDRATAASFTNWRIREPEPTVTDPEFDETSDDDMYRDIDNDDAMMGGDISEDALAGMFDALATMLRTPPPLRAFNGGLSAVDGRASATAVGRRIHFGRTR